MPPMGFILKQQVPEAAPLPSGPLGVPFDLYQNPSTGLIWVADYAIPFIPAYNATTRVTAAVVSTASAWGTGGNPGASRIIGDATNLYASGGGVRSPGGGGTAPNLLLIINQATAAIVGLCDVGGAGWTVLDQCLDGAGNIYVVADHVTATTSNVQKFSIAAAIAAYPAPVTATVSSATLFQYTSCAFDTGTNVLYVTQSDNVNPSIAITAIANSGGQYVITTGATQTKLWKGSKVDVSAGGTTYPGATGTWAVTQTGPSTLLLQGSTFSGSFSAGGHVLLDATPVPRLYALDPTTLAEINHLVFVVPFPYQGGALPPWGQLLASNGSIWASCTTPFDGTLGDLLRVDPTTFPADASVVTILTATPSSAYAPAYLSYDAVGNTILEGVYGGASGAVSRVSVSTDLLVSSITGLSQFCVNATGAGGDIWITEAGALLVYSSGIGTETLLHTITSY